MVKNGNNRSFWRCALDLFRRGANCCLAGTELFPWHGDFYRRAADRFQGAVEFIVRRPKGGGRSTAAARLGFRRVGMEQLGLAGLCQRVLALEALEPRTLLAAVTYDPSLGETQLTNDPRVADWRDNVSGIVGAWNRGDDGTINLSSPTVIQLGDANAPNDLIQANSLQISGANCTFSGASYGGGLQIPTAAAGATATTIDVAANLTADFSQMSLVSQSTTGNVATTDSGTVVIDANSTAAFNSLTVGVNSGDNGTLEVDGTLNITAGGTLTIAQSATLTGTGSISLGAGASLVYASSASSVYDGNISGAGSVDVDAAANSVTLGYGGIGFGGNNYTYTGGTTIQQGTVQLDNSLASLGLVQSATTSPTTGSLTIETGATFDLNGFSTTIGPLYDGTNGTGGGGTVNNSAAGIATLTIVTNQIDGPDIFSGSIGGALTLEKGGNGLLSLAPLALNGFSGGTVIYAGVFQAGNYDAIPSQKPLTMWGNATFDLDGNECSFSTLNGGVGDEITNTATTLGTLTVDGSANPNYSVFGGEIVDGAQGAVALSLDNAGLTLTNTNDTFSGGTAAFTSNLVLGDGTHNGMVTGSILCTDEGSVTFNVAASSTVTFNGYIQVRDNTNVPITKGGPGTLVLGSAYSASNYFYTTILAGTVVLASGSSLPASSNLTIENEATLDLGGTALTTLNDLELEQGAVIDGTLAVATTVTAEEGTIGANLSGTGVLEKEPGAGNDTVVVNGACNLAGGAEVDEGTLVVNGLLGGAVVVGSPLAPSYLGTLSGDCTCSGAVVVNANGTLVMDGAAGSALTFGTLKLQANCSITEAESPVTGMLETAKVGGELIINGGTLSFLGADSKFAPFQVLFQYGNVPMTNVTLAVSLTKPPPANWQVVYDTAGNAIELAETGKVLYWAPYWTTSNPVLGGGGNWNTTSQEWLPSLASSTLTTWQDGDVAVFDGAGTGVTVALAGNITPNPTAMFFLAVGTTDSYTITGDASDYFAESQSAAIYVTAGMTAIVDASIEGTVSPNYITGLTVNLAGGTVVLNGNQTHLTSVAMFANSAGTLQAGAGLTFTSPALSVTGGTFDLNGQGVTVGSLTGTGTITNNAVPPSPGTLTVVETTNTSYTGTIEDGTDTVALAVSGTAVLTLNPAAATGNAFSGGTTVKGGTCVFAAPLAVQEGSELIVGNTGATLFAPGQQGSAQQSAGQTQVSAPTLPIGPRDDSGDAAATEGLSFVVTGTDGQTDFDVPSTGGSYPLIVFALIQDADGQADPLGNDGLYEAEVGASLTGSLIGSGNAYFKTRTNGMAAVTYQGGATSASGTNVWGSGDTMGIGASDPTDVSGPVNNTIFLGTNNVWSPANGIDSALGADANTWSTDGASYATLAGYPNYTAIPIAKFTVSFSTRLPAGESATLAGIAGSVGGQGVDIWSEAGANYQQDGSNDLQTPLGAVNPGKFNGFLNTVTFSTAGTDGDFVAATTGASSPVESALAGAATPAAVAASSTGSPAALVQARVAAGRAATRAIAGILEPSSQTQPKGIFQEADLERIAVMLAGQGSDAGTPSGIDPSAVDAALAQLAESGGFTATPNGNQPIAPFSDATDDPFVATDNSILEFFQTYDLSC